ncbi:MAG: DNA repair and recombination protein RadB [Nanoarchaeota archaeon]
MEDGMERFRSGRTSSGSEVVDSLLEGGFENDVITTIYGPAGSGKTNIVLNALTDQISKDKTVIYIDTEGSFSVERARQLCPKFKEYARNLLFLKPTTFEEQKFAFEKLEKAIAKKEDIAFIIIDSIAMLYRLEIGKNQDVYTINRELGVQLGRLTEIARKRLIPVLITNQVYADFDSTQKDAVKMVGGDLLKYSSKCLIELKKASHGVRVAVLKKHRSIPEGKEAAFTIRSEGLVKTELTEEPAQDDELI